MSQYRMTFSRQAVAPQSPEVVSAADFDSLDAAESAGRRWVDEDPVRHGYEISLMAGPAGPPAAA